MSIRICPGEKPVQGPPRWQPALWPPLDALTTRVDDVVEVLNALPDWEGLPEGTFCTQEGRPRIHYVIAYPDGTTESVTYGYGACHLLELGPPGDPPTAETIAKADATTFMHAVSEGLLAQRRDGRAPDRLPAVPPCVPDVRPYSILPTRDLELAVAALCVLDRHTWRRAVLPSGLVDRLTDEYAAAVRDRHACSPSYVGKVVGWSTWGDPVELQLWDGCAVAGSAWAPNSSAWTVSPELLTDLLSLAGPSP